MSPITTDLPKFINDDPTAIAKEIAAYYQEKAGKQLYPGQVEQLLIDLIAYRESMARAAFNDAGRQNLVAFARAPMLDYLGELVGVTRLSAQRATGKVKLTFPALASDSGMTQVILPAGSKIAGNANVQFQTTAELVATLNAGKQEFTMDVEATVRGDIGNGFQPADLNQLVDDPGVKVDVVGVGVTAGGIDVEDDERLRERIRLAPESFSVAGSVAAYRHHALSATQGVLDVAVVSASNLGKIAPPGDPVQPGEVRLFPLFRGNQPGAGQLDQVKSACSADRVRPLTDKVTVAQPPSFEFQVTAKLQLYAGSDSQQTLQAANASLDAYLAGRADKLGCDIVPSQLVAALSVPGVYQVTLSQPAAAVVVPYFGWSHCTARDIQLDAADLDGVDHD